MYVYRQFRLRWIVSRGCGAVINDSVGVGRSGAGARLPSGRQFVTVTTCRRPVTRLTLRRCGYVRLTTPIQSSTVSFCESRCQNRLYCYAYKFVLLKKQLRGIIVRSFARVIIAFFDLHKRLFIVLVAAVSILK